MNNIRKLGIALCLIMALFVCTEEAWAESWGTKIRSDENKINKTNSTAVIDTNAYEIKLPKNVHNALMFEGEEFDYSVLTPTGVKRFSWTGDQLVENTLIGVTGVTNTVACAVGGEYPDIVIATSDKVTRYGFSGSMQPVYNILGFTEVISVGTRDNDISVVTPDSVQYYGFTGDQYVNNTRLSLSGLTNTVDIGLAPNSFDVVVASPSEVKYYCFTGSELIENTMLKLSGLSGVKSVEMNDIGRVAVIEGNVVKGYTIGSSMAYSAALSVTSGLTNPISVALRRNSNDMIILDGDQIRYYMYNGSSMVYNPTLSKTIAGLSNLGGYVLKATVESVRFTLARTFTKARVRAFMQVPTGTKITWSISADSGTTWIKKWRAVGNASGGYVEYTNDNGTTWTNLGSITKAQPGADNELDLWCTIPSTTGVNWKAELETSDRQKTPVIKSTNPGVTDAIVIDSNSPPTTPTVDVPAGANCFTSSTPELRWTFSDPDIGDSQSRYKVSIYKASDSILVHEIAAYGNQTSYVIPPGILFNTGVYQFKTKIEVWDQAGDSAISALKDFCVVAFENPRISDIVSPSTGQVKPNPADESTWIGIPYGTVQANLPKTKAGGAVTLKINAIGVQSVGEPTITYNGKQASKDTPVISKTVGTNNVYDIRFWTKANLADCPNGTLVTMTIRGTRGTNTPVLRLDKSYNPRHAEGVVTTNGTILENWFVILNGRN
jgi:hypothetical protein